MAESGTGEEAPPTRVEAPAGQDGDQEEPTLEEQIVTAISEGDVTKVQALLVSRRGDPNFCDKHGMTPLHHAAYKGIPQLVQLLLDQVRLLIVNYKLYLKDDQIHVICINLFEFVTVI